jgi:hypothetical protein
MTKLENELLDFLSEHEHVIVNALNIQISDMSKAAGEMQAHYERAEADPELRATYEAPGSMITVNGLFQSAQMFRESAAKAQAALDALDTLGNHAEEL